MRDMTEHEKDLFYTRRIMPCGCGNTFFHGPRGGLMMNIECTACGLKLNIIDPDAQSVFVGRGKKNAPVRQLGIGQVIHEPPGYKAFTPPTFLSQLLEKLREAFTFRRTQT